MKYQCRQYFAGIYENISPPGSYKHLVHPINLDANLLKLMTFISHFRTFALSYFKYYICLNRIRYRL
jgi:hypothetical protein